MSDVVVKSDRLAVRVTARQKDAIERAAALLGRSVSDFSVQTLTERAEEVLTDRKLFSVSEGAWEEFAAKLDGPVQSVPEVVALLRRPTVFDQ
jgi:uncharacterized protein (DUF1778 family)